MHDSSYLRMEWFRETYLKEKQDMPLRILDIGAFDVNGSYKDIFKNKNWNYMGLDMECGPNVDIVIKDSYNWEEIFDESFDVIISGQAFEHMQFFWLAMEELSRALKPNGICCIIAPSQGAEHKYPVDCYRFFCDGIEALGKYVGFEILHASSGMHEQFQDTYRCMDKETQWKDSMLVARKPVEWKPSNHSTQYLKNVITEQRDIIKNFETATCWKLTKPLRLILDKIKKIEI